MHLQPMKDTLKTKFFLLIMPAALLAAFLVLSFPSKGVASQEALRVRVAVLPWKINAGDELEYLGGAVTDMLTSRVGATGEVEILRGDLVVAALKGFGQREPAEKIAEAVGERLGADYVVFGSISVLGDQVSLDARLYDVKKNAAQPLFNTGVGLDAIVFMTEDLARNLISVATGRPIEDVPSYTGRFTSAGERDHGERGFADEGAYDEEGLVIRSKKREKRFGWKRSLDGFVKAMETADLDGDGKKEVVFVTENDVTIARFTPRGVKTIKRLSGDGESVNVSVSAFDSDGDGRTELYLSRLRGSMADGCILEAKDGSFAFTSCGIPFFMRALRIEGEGTVLLGQMFRKEWGFKKKINVLRREGADVVVAGDFYLPPKVNLYGFEVFDLTGDGENELVVLDSRRHLRVYVKKGKRWVEEWRSPDTYGGTLNIIDLAEGNEQEPGGFVSIQSRFLYADLDMDGMNELIIKKNVAGGIFGERSERVRSFKSGTVRGLSWDGVVLAEDWKTNELNGYVSDFLIEDTDGDGNKELLILFIGTKGLYQVEDKTTLVSYKLSIQ